MNPDFEDVGFIETPTKEAEERYTENFHLEGVERKIVSIYEEIKNEMRKTDPAIKANPQHYYVSLRKNKNFAYIKLRRKKMHIIMMLPYEAGNILIKKHKLTQLSEGIKNSMVVHVSESL